MLNLTFQIGETVVFPFKIDDSALTVEIYFGTDRINSSDIVVQATDSNNVFFLKHSPTSTGKYTYIVNGEIKAVVDIAPKSVFSFLGSIEDALLGSWIWDKKTGVITYYKQDGDVLCQYDVRDSLIQSSREKI